MRAASLQFVKETRQLAWPWTLLVAACLLAIFLPRNSAFGLSVVEGRMWRDFIDALLPTGAFAGTIFLGALVIGAEFQHRTFALRLAQPLSREVLWRQKMWVTILAVGSITLLYSLTLGKQVGRFDALLAAAWGVSALAGSLPMALLSRSTIGAVALNTVICSPVMWICANFEVLNSTSGFVWFALSAGVVLYVAGLVWLGRRMLLRFQAVDGMQASAFVPGENLVPRFIAESLDCRSDQPLRNLFRRELRLLRTLWPLAVLCLIAWTLVATFAWVPITPKPSRTTWIAFVVTWILTMLVAVLAGALSLGEEKSSGTHNWNMTLPIQPATQWFVKLIVGVAVAVVVCAVLPMFILAVGGWTRGDAWLFLDPKSNLRFLWPGSIALMAVAAFWCSCVVKSTVRAVGWLLPLTLAIGMTGPLGEWLSKAINEPPTDVTGWFVEFFDPMRWPNEWMVYRGQLPAQGLVVIAIALVVGALLIQSARTFREGAEDTNLRVVMSALPLLALAVICTIAMDLFHRIFYKAVERQDYLIMRVHEALVKKRMPQGVTVLSADDIAATLTTDSARRWLGKARIVTTSVAFDPNDKDLWERYRYMNWAGGSRVEKPDPFIAIMSVHGGRHTCIVYSFVGEIKSPRAGSRYYNYVRYYCD